MRTTAISTRKTERERRRRTTGREGGRGGRVGGFTRRERDHCRIYRRSRSRPTDGSFSAEADFCGPQLPSPSRSLPLSPLVAIRMIHQAAVRSLPSVPFARSPLPRGSADFDGQAQHACACVRACERGFSFEADQAIPSFLRSFFPSFLSSFRSSLAFCKRWLPPGRYSHHYALPKEAVTIYTQLAFE